MTFYIKPPRGILNLHILEDCIKERLLCYENLKNKNFEVCHYQYLVEDSSLDRTGHFILRLLACSDRTFQNDFVNAELNLLEARLNSFSKQDAKQFFKRLLKHSREAFENNENIDLREIYLILIRAFSFMVRNDYLKHMLKTEYDLGCEAFTIKVPFHICLSLVSKREVDISNGFVQIPCIMWKKFLLSLFETYLNTVLKIMKSSGYVNNVLEDMRITNILQFVKNYVSKNSLKNSSKKNTARGFTNIFEESHSFPLCMMSLLKVLEINNRLAHNERFDFSLYLKDVGMSMSDSLKFWENLYSKEHSTCSKCTHNWQKNEKRYIYGIRHLYGFEGSRKDYHCRNCTYFQEKTLGPREDGGCPFKQFDDTNLRNILKSVIPTKPDEIDVMIFERNQDPNIACRIFFETIYSLKTNNNLNKDLKFNSPVDYYIQLKQELDNE